MTTLSLNCIVFCTDQYYWSHNIDNCLQLASAKIFEVFYFFHSVAVSLTTCEQANGTYDGLYLLKSVGVDVVVGPSCNLGT